MELCYMKELWLMFGTSFSVSYQELVNIHFRIQGNIANNYPLITKMRHDV